MADFDPVYDSVERLPALTLVNASAGTGKTWTVTHVATRWLLEVPGREPSGILLVTFAREAAGELKSRLRRHVEEYEAALVAIRDGHPITKHGEEEWHLQLRELAKEVGSVVLLQRVRDALARLDDVNARTIHSFASLLRGGDDGFSADAKLLRQRAAREVLVRAAEDEGVQLSKLLGCIDTSGDPIDRLQEILADTVGLTAAMGGLGPDGSGLAHFTALPDVDIDNEKEKTVKEAAEYYATLVLRTQSNEKRLRTLRGETTFDAVIGDLVNEVRLDPDTVRSRLGRQFGLVIIDEFQDTDAGQWEIFSTLFLKGSSRAPVMVVGDAKQSIYGFRGADVTVMQRVMKMIDADPSMRLATLRRNYRSHGGLLKQLNEFYSAHTTPHVFVEGSADTATISYEEVESPEHLNDSLGLFTIRDVRELSWGEGQDDACSRDVLLEIQRLTSGELKPEERPSSKAHWELSDIVILSRGKTALRELQWAMEQNRIPYVTPRTLSVFSSMAASEVRWLLWALADPSDVRRWRSLRASWFGAVAEGMASASEIAKEVALRGVGPLHRRAVSGAFLNVLLSHPGGQRHVTDVEHVFSALAEAFPGAATCSEMLTWVESAIAEANEPNDGIDGQRRIESDENAVRLMTVHASKGLEFPVVFVVGIESNGKAGYPLVVATNEPSGKVIDVRSATMPSKARGDRTKPEKTNESDRLIYVALTRAVSVLTVWQTTSMANADTAPAWHRLWQPWEGDKTERGPLMVSVDQASFAGSTLRKGGKNSEHLRNAEVLPIRRDPFEPLRRWSYSTLHNQSSEGRGDVDKAADAEDEQGQNGGRSRRGYFAFGRRRGASFGDALHGAFEEVVGTIPASEQTKIEKVLLRQFAAQGLTPSSNTPEAFVRLLRRPLGAAWGDLCLDEYALQQVSVASEMRFTIPLHPNRDGLSVLKTLCELVVLHDADGPFVGYFSDHASRSEGHPLTEGYLSGSIDLVAPALGATQRFHVLDYKSNGLTITEDFSPESLALEMAASGYPLQALLYSVALHRHLLATLSGYQPDKHLGGATYLYVRGASLIDAAPDEGVFHWDIPSELTLAVSSLLGGETK